MNYSYEYSLSNGSASGAGGIIALLSGGIMLVIELVLIVLIFASYWRLFTKAGKAGWTGIIPFLNSLQLLDIAGKPWWWIIMYCIPVVNIVFMILTYIDLVRAYGKSGGWVVGLLFLPMIFFPILAFGSAQYHRPADWPQPWLNI